VAPPCARSTTTYARIPADPEDVGGYLRAGFRQHRAVGPNVWPNTGELSLEQKIAASNCGGALGVVRVDKPTAPAVTVFLLRSPRERSDGK